MKDALSDIEEAGEVHGLTADQAEFKDLVQANDQMANMAKAQAGLAETIRQGAGPGNETARGKVTATTHVHPDALHYVSDIYTVLLDMRVGMDLALAPPPPPAKPAPAKRAKRSKSPKGK